MDGVLVHDASRPLGAALAGGHPRAAGEAVDLRPGDGAVPRRAAAGRHRLRGRRGRADHGPARRGLRAERCRSRLHGARRDPYLQLRGHHPGDPADHRRSPLHRHQSRPDRPSPAGPLPATGSVSAMISKATGREPYFVGKPNPLMMRSALRAIEAHSESTAMIGDRMDTDVVAGLEAGLETILVLSGVSTREEANSFPYRPNRIVDSVADLLV